MHSRKLTADLSCSCLFLSLSLQNSVCHSVPFPFKKTEKCSFQCFPPASSQNSLLLWVCLDSMRSSGLLSHELSYMKGQPITLISCFFIMCPPSPMSFRSFEDVDKMWQLSVSICFIWRLYWVTVTFKQVLAISFWCRWWFVYFEKGF